MRYAIAFVVAFLVGAGCRYFEIPVPSPPAIPGVILIGAITLGYLTVDKVVLPKRQEIPAARQAMPSTSENK